MGPTEPGAEPVAACTAAALAMRSGLATPGQLLRLDRIELVIAPQQQCHRRAILAGHDQGFQAA